MIKKFKSKNKKFEIWINQKKDLIIFTTKEDKFQKFASCVYRFTYERLNEILKEQAKPIIKDYFTTNEYWREIFSPDLHPNSDLSHRGK